MATALTTPSRDLLSPLDPTNPSDNGPTTVSAAHHRPISLQSPADLLHLRATALRAARAKIDLHLPADADGDGDGITSDRARGKEDMRKAVERLVDEWIERVFQGVRDGVEINGIRGPESVSWGTDASSTTNKDGKGGEVGKMPGGEEYETYDTKLATRLTTLHGRIEELNLELANTRREAVGRSARGFKEEFGRWDVEMGQMERETFGLREGSAGNDAMDVDGEEKVEDLGLKLDFVEKGRQEDVRRRFDGAVGTLQRLARDMNAVEGRAAEAEKLVEYMESR